MKKKLKRKNIAFTRTRERTLPEKKKKFLMKL